MKEIKTREDMNLALKQSRSVIMFAKPDCLHCSIVRTCLESVEAKYPLVDFYFTEGVQFADARHIDAFPVLVFYEHGAEQGRLVGSGHIVKIKDILNLWFRKE